MEIKNKLKRSKTTCFGENNNKHDNIAKLLNTQIKTDFFIKRQIINNFLYRNVDEYSENVKLKLSLLTKSQINIVLKNDTYDFDCLTNFFNVLFRNKDLDYKFCKYCFDNYLIKKFNNIENGLQQYYYKDDMEKIEKILLVKHIELLKDFKDTSVVNYIKEKSGINEKSKLFTFDTLIKLNDDDLKIINNNLLISKRIFNSYSEINIHKQAENKIMLENLKMCNSISIDNKYSYIKM